ncbi:MAG: endonuclease/exonuclease/phosphatase family protein [Planctomycetaceae bacterium]
MPLSPVVAGRLLAVLSIGNLGGVLVLLVLICVVSERWGFSTALSYLPRAPYLLPSLLLTAAALLLRRRWIWINLFSLLLVAGPLMGFRVPWGAWMTAASGETLTVVTCNLQVGKGDLTKVAREIDRIQPDVLVLQEATHGIEALLPFFEGWSRIHLGEYLVASKYPVRLRDICRPNAFSRASAILCEIEGPGGPFLVCDVHLTTARHGLTHLRWDSPMTQTGVEQLKLRQAQRAKESFETRAFTSQHGFEVPLLAVGDFNAPTSSSLFQQYWTDLTSAFDAGGLGYGYTSPCAHHRRWPDNTPWLRIDHILCSSQWDVERCWTGRSDGSDHRLVAARLRLREAP